MGFSAHADALNDSAISNKINTNFLTVLSPSGGFHLPGLRVYPLLIVCLIFGMT
jgi:hypothetical protein